MNKKYTRLKLKMLLMVFVGALAAWLLGYLLLEYFIDGVFQDPFARAYVWICQTVFSQTEAEALMGYQLQIRDNKEQIFLIGMLLLMMVAFYVAMGRFTRWLDEIGVAIRLVVAGEGKPVKLAKELAPVQGDLNEIQRTLARQAEEEMENQQRKSDLVAFLAHDLKTPLTSVVGYLRLLHEKPDLDTEQRAKYMGIALEKAVRLEELLSEFFDISRMDLQSGGGERARIHLSILLEQLSDEFWPIFGEKNLTLHTDIQPGLEVIGDPERLARVFDNVLRNAVNYSAPGGRVEVSACRQGDWLNISIANEGMEIPEQELANIFRKFYRLDTARSSRTGGAGLGLAIAKEITEAHGGTIRAESDGKRAIFHITLPGEGTT